jgi:hypothetical protein
MLKAIRTIAASLIIISAVFMPNKANALIPPLVQFGGYSVATVPCTCSIAEWGFFAPLYVVGAVPLAGPLVYFPAGTIPFPYFLLTIPAVPHLGSFIPAVQACWEYAGFFCFPLPSYGVMAFAGTGLPFAK